MAITFLTSGLVGDSQAAIDSVSLGPRGTFTGTKFLGGGSYGSVFALRVIMNELNSQRVQPRIIRFCSSRSELEDWKFCR